MSKWIRSDEMLPSKRKRVLFYSSIMKEVIMGNYDFYSCEWKGFQYDWSDEKMQQSVTHWMYVPDEPEKENGL